MATHTAHPVPPHLEAGVKWARSMKDTKVADTAAGENDDLTPRLQVRRDGEDICLIFCRDVDRDAGLQAALIAVPGFAADDLDMILDAHMADHRFIEKYGREPDPHELQTLCDVEGLCELNVITDALVVFRVTRAGSLEMVHLPYHVHKTARTVHWLDSDIAYYDSKNPSERVDGRVPLNLRKAFETPVMSPTRDGIDPADFGLDDDNEIRAHMDMSICRILTSGGWAVAMTVPADNPVRAEIIDESTKRMANVSRLVDDEWLDPDPDLLSPEAETVDALGRLLGSKLAAERKAKHASELAEAASRRAARESGDWKPETLEEILAKRQTGVRNATVGNRAERRKQARNDHKRR